MSNSTHAMILFKWDTSIKLWRKSTAPQFKKDYSKKRFSILATCEYLISFLEINKNLAPRIH